MLNYYRKDKTYRESVQEVQTRLKGVPVRERERDMRDAWTLFGKQKWSFQREQFVRAVQSQVGYMEKLLGNFMNTEITQKIFKASREKKHPNKASQSDIRLLCNSMFWDTREQCLHCSEEK